MLIDKKVTKKKLLNVCECVYKWVSDKREKLQFQANLD